MAVTINGSTGVSGVDGSSGTPAVIGSDADTGLYFAAGQVQASLNGTVANVALVSGTAQASTSGTSIDFTGIPSWVKRITVMFSGVSTNGTSAFLIQIGTSAGVTTSGYSSAGSNIGTGSTNMTNSTAGFVLTAGGDASTTSYDGLISVSLINASSNAWVSAGTLRRSTNNSTHTSGGNVTLSGALDRVRITTANGTDTFDAGTINIMYE